MAKAKKQLSHQLTMEEIEYQRQQVEEREYQRQQYDANSEDFPDETPSKPVELSKPEIKTVEDQIVNLTFLAKQLAKNAGLPIGSVIQIMSLTLNYQIAMKQMNPSPFGHLAPQETDSE